jgi:hypothetical protein
MLTAPQIPRSIPDFSRDHPSVVTELSSDDIQNEETAWGRTEALPRWPAISASIMSLGESLSGSPMHCRSALMLLHCSPPISVKICGQRPASVTCAQKQNLADETLCSVRKTEARSIPAKALRQPRKAKQFVPER